MRSVCRSAVVLLAVAAAAAAQGQPPGPRPANQPPPTSQLPAEIVPDSNKPQGTPGGDWVAEWDDTWKRRNDPAAIQRLEALADQHLAQDPDGFESNWRKAALIAWEACREPAGS